MRHCSLLLILKGKLQRRIFTRWAQLHLDREDKMKLF